MSLLAKYTQGSIARYLMQLSLPAILTIFLNISDYALLHKTCRKKNSGTRISIDTTFYVGNNFSIARERKFEYSNKIPEIGTKMFAKCHVSENEKINNNKSKLTHYTKDKVSYIDI